VRALLPRRLDTTGRFATVAALALAAGAAVFVLVTNRGTWFYLDEWDFAVRAQDFSAESILYPQNQNWHSTLVILDRLLLELFGFDTYVPFRIVGAALVAAVALLAYVYARRRIGPWWALLPLALVAVSPGYEVVLWPFQIGQLLSVACGLGALVLLDREAARRGKLAAAGLLVVAVASSSAGVPLVAVVLFDRLLRRGHRLEALVTAPAIVAYVWWWAEYGSREPRPNQFNADAWNAAVRRAVDVGDGAVQALLGLSSQGSRGALLGQIGFAVLVVVVCWRVFGRYSEGRGRVIAIAGGLVTYWCLLAWGRHAQTAIELSGRYLFLSQVLLMLLLVEVAPSFASWLRDERAARRRGMQAVGGVTAAAVLVVAVLALVHNGRVEQDFGRVLRENANAMRGQVYGLALLPDERRAAATVYLEPLGFQIPRPASRFFETLREFDWSSSGEGDVRALPADGRSRADQALFATYARPVPSGGELSFGGPPPEVAPVGGSARLRADGSCTTLRAGERAPVAVQSSPTGIAVVNEGEAPLTVQGRRYASDWNGPARVEVAPESSLVVGLTPDRGTAPWEIRAAGEAARICSLGG
jgi:hypothetical protein